MERTAVGVTCLLLVHLLLSFNAFGCDKVELNALMELKSAINYPNGNALAHWSAKPDQMGRPANFCNWDRVNCYKSRHVVDLYLYEVRPKSEGGWYVNASLFLPFRHLRILDLTSNFITGWTHHIRELTSLEDLIMDYNNLQGMIDIYDIEALENLQFLSLGNNAIDGFKRSHGNLSKASKLESLGLWDIGYNDANTFLDSLSLFPSLKSISLYNNDMGAIRNGWLCQLKNIQELDIEGSHLQEFPLCLRNLKSLQTLDLRNNNLHGEIPSFLANITTLRSLDLSSNQLMGNLGNSPLNKLTSIRYLTLSDNNFQIPHTFLPFSNHSTLKMLCLDNNKFIQDDATQQHVVPKIQLVVLSMSNCNIAAKLSHIILSQVNLQYLDLSHNSIEGSFPSWILKNNKHLVIFNLANNSLSGSLHLSSHYQLHVLDVSNNRINHLSTNLSQFIPSILFLNLSRNSIKAIIPSNFGDMINISFLDLSYNHMNGEIPKDCFKGCVSLEGLFLSNNNLENTPSLSDSTSLRILRLNNNNLSETMPSRLLPSSLQLLDMSNNHLRGEIHSEFCRLKFLNFLDLSNNKLSGFLPPCFDGSNLSCVFLNNNKLNGSLLPIFYNNTSLVTFNLRNNHLSGAIPKWIGDLHSLTTLILSNNNFKGEIPKQVCSLDQIAILDLSRNNISGRIPRCLSHLSFQPAEKKSKLEENSSSILIVDTITPILLMESTYISDETESYLTIQNKLDITTKSHTYTYKGEDLDEMSLLDLSCNNLRGEIPPELESIVGVRAVNLSHNKLDGLIPSTLSNLRSIESLDLSFNHLNGSIPVELIQLHGLEVFNVTYNNLSGEIPKQAQFGTFDESSYRGNPHLCGPPFLKDCFTYTPSISQNHVDGLFDMHVFSICFAVSSMIMFVGTLVVLYVNPYWRRVWFYFAEMWITCIYYFIVDSVRKTMKMLVSS